MINFSENEIKEILKQAYVGNEFAEIYYEKNETNNINIEDSKINKINTGISEGVGIRIIENQNTVYGYTNDISYESLIRLAKKLNINKENKAIKNFNIKLEKETALNNIKINIKM